jgi:hypothetical protein
LAWRSNSKRRMAAMSLSEPGESSVRPAAAHRNGLWI